MPTLRSDSAGADSRRGGAGVGVGPAPDAATEKKGTCPWPFILLHDPKTGMEKWQTWAAAGLALLYAYAAFVHR